MDVKAITITPEIAERLLDANPRNRAVKPANLKKVIKQMKEGTWRVNGDTIRVDTEGFLLDGQHRLLAVCATGISYEGILVTGLPPEVFDTIDQGVKRTPGDILAVHGVKNSIRVSAALPIVAEYLSGGRDFENANSRFRDDLRRLYDTHRGIEDSALMPAFLQKLTTPRVLTALHYLFSLSCPEKAEAFFNAVATGENMVAGDPPLVLRSRLIENLAAKAKVSPWYLMALWIKAWNAYCLGSKLRMLRYIEGGGRLPGIFPVNLRIEYLKASHRKAPTRIAGICKAKRPAHWKQWVVRSAYLQIRRKKNEPTELRRTVRTG